MFSGQNRIETDYPGRIAFLNATVVMEPAPIVTLQELVPAFRTWFSRFELTDEEPAIAEFRRAHAQLNSKLSILDDSLAARILRDALLCWMNSHRFDVRDQWIADAALFSLGSAEIEGRKFEWEFLPGPESHPKFNPPATEWNPWRESLDEYNAREDRVH